MKKLGVILFLAAVMAVGCGKDETKPSVTRLVASESCGVAPLAVEFRADASGGQPAAEPTGGNSFLKIRWDFGDGTVVQDGASVAFHTYAEPDTYLVSVTAEDDGGNVSPPYTRPVIVLGDTLTVTAFSTVNGELTNVVNPCQPISFGIHASGCDFDPETGYYERFLYTWTFEQPNNTVVYRGPRPTHTFPPSASGDFNVSLRIEDTALALTRRLTVPVFITLGNGTQLALTADWLDNSEVSETIQVPVDSLPGTFTYSLKLSCTGPDPGFGVGIHGRLPVNNQIGVLGIETQTGDDLAYSVVDSLGLEVRTFVWTVPEIAPGETRTAEVTLSMPILWAGSIQDSWHRIQTYPCDGDTTNNRVRARLQAVE
jgi:PKD repeat protein